jgi:purine-binding chemotaxis protein CheW
MISKLNTDIKNTNANSYLSFNLGEETFAIEVAKIMEILEVPKITKVPKAPAHLVGAVNLRGGVLPVIDTRIKFDKLPTEFSVNTCILVLTIKVNDEVLNVGALVDAVSEVFELDEKNIKASPTIGTRYRADFINGMIQEKDQLIMLLEIDKVFTTPEMEVLLDIKHESSLTV